MNKLTLITGMLLLAITMSVTAQDKKTTQIKEEKKTENVGSKLNTLCPVSHEEADENITYTHEGKTYALCCKTCLKKFKKDPEKYIKKMDQEPKKENTNNEKQ